MAATALDIVSLERMKDELRIPYSEVSQDSMITGQLQVGVSFVAQEVTAPLIDRTEMIQVQERSKERSIFLRASYLKQVMGVRYWNPDGALRMPANASIMVAELGRTQHHYRRGVGPLWAGLSRGLWVWPPADGWPEVLTGSCFEFDVQRGLTIDEDTEALAQAVILCTRQLYDGYPKIEPTSAFRILIERWKSVAPD